MSRRRAREKSLQGLYQMDMTRCSLTEALDMVTNEPGEADADFMMALMSGTAKHREKIDPVIVRYAQGWDISRMATIDRNVLRIALYELLYRPETPVNVVLNEAVELAKEFSTAESGKFVNGILGKVVQDLAELRQGVETE